MCEQVPFEIFTAEFTGHDIATAAVGYQGVHPQKIKGGEVEMHHFWMISALIGGILANGIYHLKHDIIYIYIL